MSKFIDMAAATFIFLAIALAIFGQSAGVYTICAITAVLFVIQDFMDRREYYARRTKSVQARRKARMDVSQ